MQETALPHLLQHCHALAWHTLPPRQPMDVERWSEAWADALAQLNEFASHGYYGLDVPDLARMAAGCAPIGALAGAGLPTRLATHGPGNAVWPCAALVQ